MSELRVVFTETPENPWMNLAWEEAFFQSRCNDISDDVLRIWRNKSAVVIGVFQKASEEVNLEFAEQVKAGVVRRFTGGGAVYHDLGNINFALSVKPRGLKVSVDYLYGELLYGVVKALERLGFKPEVQNVNDIIVGDRKVVGIAASMKRESNCGFIHGAVLYDVNLDILAGVLKIPLKKLADKGISSVKYRVTNITALKPEVRERDVILSLIGSFMEVLDKKSWFPDIPKRVEFELAEKLYIEKYVTKEWNFDRKRP
ncbi:MAG: biotin/lipoate A/B protein ligase family protein [Thermosphaera sp.]